ncbi:MAG: hypothetical protein ACOC84_04490 [Actinomycetota bacterium]
MTLDRTSTQTTPPDDSPQEEKPEKKAPTLNVPGLLAGAASAATVAVIGGHLSVAGTVLGAALMSLISGVAVALYSASLEKGRHGLKKVHATVTQRVRGRSGLDAPQSDGSTPVADGDSPATGSRWRSLRLKPVLLSTGISVGLAVAAIFGIQALTGTELSSGTGQIQRTVTGEDSVAVRNVETTTPEIQPTPGTGELAPTGGLVPTEGVPSEAPTAPGDLTGEEAAGSDPAPAEEQLPGSGSGQPDGGGSGADSAVPGPGTAGGQGAADAGAGAAPAAP